MTIAAERLAIEGGTPVREQYLPYGRQSIDDEDVAAVAAALRSDWLTTGPKVEAFEDAFARFTAAPRAVAVSSGTAALHAAAVAAGIGPGDEVIVPALTFAATANCVRYVGGTVVFADIRSDMLNLDVRKAEELVTSRTRAIISVDLTGLPSDLDELLELCRARGLVLIEDAAHSLGATYRDRPVGAIADLTTFSLHPVKLMTTAEGGVVTTSDESRAERMRRFRSHGLSADHRERGAAGTWTYDMPELGFNYRLSDLQCALGISQLRKVAGWLRRRTAIAQRYSRDLGALPWIELPTWPNDRTSGWHLYMIRLVLDRLEVDRAQVFRALRAENIGVNVHYVPVPWLSYYERLGYGRGRWPVAESEYQRLLTLPIFPAMTETDVDDVVRAVTKVLGRYARP